MLDFVKQSRLVLPLALLTLVTVPLVWRLVSFPDPYVAREPLTPGMSAAVPRALDLAPVRRYAGADILQVRLHAASLRDVISARELDLEVATHQTDPKLLQATLQIEGTSCRFAAAPSTPLVNNALLPLFRQGACERLDGVPTGDLTLEIWLESGTGRAALWTFEAPAGQPPALFAMAGTTTLALRGIVVKEPRPVTRSRLSLLAYLWDVTPNVLWARLRGNAVALAAGLVLLCWRQDTTARWISIGRAALGTTLLFAAIGATYALIFPPLQTPDEPDHLLSLATLRSDPDLKSETEALAQRTHLERIRHRGDQHFREIDVAAPWLEKWSDEIHDEPVRAKSPVIAWWWETVDSRADRSITQRLWMLRRANAVLFGISCGVSVALLGLAIPGTSPYALVLGLLAVPTLPFFGSSFADTAVIISTSLLLASCCAALLVGQRRPWMGAVMGIAVTLALLSGRRIWPLFPVVGLLLLARALSGGAEKQRTRDVLFFWAALGVTLAFGLWAAQDAGLFSYAESLVKGRAPELLKPALAAVVARIWVAAPLVMLLAGVEVLTSRFAWSSFPTRKVAVLVSGLLSLWLVGGLLSSLVIAYPTSARVVDLRSGMWAYTAQVLEAMAVPFRLAHHDLLLSLLFWGGMGWVDTSPPLWILNLLIAATTAALVVTLARATQHRGQVLRFALLAGGLVLSLAIYAAASFVLQYALYGRYLAGWYLLIVVPAWTAAALMPRYATPLLVLLLAVHAYYLQLVPLRYF